MLYNLDMQLSNETASSQNNQPANTWQSSDRSIHVPAAAAQPRQDRATKRHRHRESCASGCNLTQTPNSKLNLDTNPAQRTLAHLQPLSAIICAAPAVSLTASRTPSGWGMRRR